MKILVTGSAGFLGYHLSHALLSQGHDVVGIDSLMSGQERNLADLQQTKNFTFFKRDINDLTPSEIVTNAPLKAALTGLDRVFHLACPASPPIYQRDMLHTLDTCYLGSRNVYELALANKARVMIASTSEIYGDPEVHPQPESYRGNVNTMGPRSCYDEGKRIMETMGHVFALRGLEVRTARIFNTYGPRMSPHDGRVLTNFIAQALRGEALTIYGTGKQTRSFCFFSDLIAGFLKLMDSAVTEPINLGSQFEFSMEDLAKIVIAQVNPKLTLRYLDLPIDDPKVRRPDASRAKALLSWEPKVDLQTGVKAMIADFRERSDL